MSRLHVAAAVALSPFVIWPVFGLGSTPPQRRAQERSAPASGGLERPPAPGAPGSFWWADYDADGLVDAFVVQADGRGLLLHNAGGGAFEDVTVRAGLAARTAAHMALWADFDQDGLLDLYLPSALGESALVRQVEPGLFEDVSASSGLPANARPLRAAWLDLDADGLPDLHLSNAAGESLFHNEGAGRFARVTLELEGSGLADGLAPAVTTRPGPAPAEPRVESAPAATRGSAGSSPSAPLAPASGPALASPGSGSTLPSSFAPACVPSLDDDAGGLCIRASRVPTLDLLYPLSEDLFVDGGGQVGIGTLSPTRKLHVEGRFYAVVSGAGDTAIRGLSNDGRALLAESYADDYPAGEFRQFGGGAILDCETATGLSALRVRGTGGLAALSDFASTDASLSSAIVARNTAAGDGHGLFAWTEGTGETVRIRQDGGGDLLLAENPDGTTFKLRAAGGLTSTCSDGSANVGLSSAVDATNTSSADGIALRARTYGTGTTVRIQQEGSGDLILADNPSTTVLRVRAEGGLTTNCSNGGSNLALSTALYATNSSTAEGNAVLARTTGTGTTMIVQQRGSGDYIRGQNADGTSIFKVTNSGRVVTTALQITGGGDLVEGFDAGGAELEPGTVVVIDAERPGRVRESAGAYDPKVAGAISGAGGVDHGIRMGQDGVLDGEALVAMTGRIYVKCSAENGAIAPGDLLTSAELAGHAMKATDPQRAFGAVIGKAMTGLDEGTGLVLVLVNLQ